MDWQELRLKGIFLAVGMINQTLMNVGVKMKIDIVDFRGGGEGDVGVYIDGDLYTQGSDYDDKIDKWIEGFLEGLKYAGISYKEKYLDASADWVEAIKEDGEDLPQKWPTKRK